MFPHRKSRLCVVASLLALLAATSAFEASPVFAKDDPVSEDPTTGIRRVSLTRFKSRTFELRTPFDSAVVGATDIADVLAMSDRVLYIQGKKVGTTNVSLFDAEKKLIGVFDVEVTIDSKHIAKQIRASTDSPGIKVSANNEQVVLTGEAKNAADAERAVAIAKALVPENSVVNLMRVAAAQQVMLKVRFLEATRSAGRNLGINLLASNEAGNRGVSTGLGNENITISQGGGRPSIFESILTFAGGSTAAPFGVALANIASGAVNIDVLITALETKGLARRLAEPDLVALSGDTASFLAGGEVPIPVVQPSASGIPFFTTEYKPFGVQLTFVPTVLANGVINLRLTPSVSQLDYTNAIRNQGILIPALTKREARTTIELRDGQSFAIAGLLQTTGIRDISQVPWLGSVPIIGALFRSNAYQQNETDLVVIVTPHLVQPASPEQKLATPFDQRLPSNDRDFFLKGKLEVPKKYNEYVTSGGNVVGPYGHMIQQHEQVIALPERRRSYK